MFDPVLAQLCANRAGLPPILPSAPIADRLQEGARLAGNALRRHTSKLASFNADIARQAEDAVAAWESRNQAALSSVMADRRVSALPEAISVGLGNEAAQNFILAGYYFAVTGMAPHMTNAVDDAILYSQNIDGVRVTKELMDDDVEARIGIFASIFSRDDVHWHGSGVAAVVKE